MCERYTSKAWASSLQEENWRVQFSEEELLFLSASQDQNIHLWQLSTTDSTLSLCYEYKGHARSVEAIAVSPDATKVNSATRYNYYAIKN